MANARRENVVAGFRAAMLAGAMAAAAAAGACGSSENDLFSDPAGGQCNGGECAACGQCPEGQHCVDGECVAGVCKPGTRACAGTSIVTCSADGSGYGEPQQCSDGCLTVADGARCGDGLDGS